MYTVSFSVSEDGKQAVVKILFGPFETFEKKK